MVKTATGTSGAIVLETDENEVEESVAVAVGVAVVVAVVDVARWLVASDGIGIVVEQWDECGEASSIRACRVRLASRSGLGCMVVVGGAGGADGAGEAEGAGDVDGAGGAGARCAGGGADSGGSVGREEVGSCDSRVIVNIVHVPIQSNPIQSKKSKIQVSYLCRPDKRVTPIHPHFPHSLVSVIHLPSVLLQPAAHHKRPAAKPYHRSSTHPSSPRHR